MGLIFIDVGITILLAYVFVFNWMLKSAGSEQSQKYTNAFSKRMKINLVGIGLVSGAFLFPSLLLSIVFFCAAIAWLVWNIFKQRHDMVKIGFDHQFITKICLASFMPVLAIGCLFAGKVLGGLNVTAQVSGLDVLCKSGS